MGIEGIGVLTVVGGGGVTGGRGTVKNEDAEVYNYFRRRL